MIDWSEIDEVFLDMDGTLLDLHFDNHFWREFVPARFAKNQGLDLHGARKLLYEKFSNYEGTMDWYCVDFWSRELDLDIEAMKGELKHLIAVLPHVEEFLGRLKGLSMKRTLVTNAHRASIKLKFECTGLDQHLDQVMCSHDIGQPKESPGFWEKLHTLRPFDKKRTLFVDDSPTVLENARAYGFGALIGICKPDSKKSAAELPGITAVENFSAIFPGMP